MDDGGLPEYRRVLLANVNLAPSPYAFPWLSVYRSSVYTIKTNDGPQSQHPTKTSSNQPPDAVSPRDQAVRYHVLTSSTNRLKTCYRLTPIWPRRDLRCSRRQLHPGNDVRLTAPTYTSGDLLPSVVCTSALRHFLCASKDSHGPGRINNSLRLGSDQRILVVIQNYYYLENEPYLHQSGVGVA